MPTSPLTRWARVLSSACRSDPALSGTTVHASCVAYQGRGILILGASGQGKSALALQLMALGARLVADDRCCLHSDGALLTARAPDAIRGRIEARFVGILPADAVLQTDVALIVDLDHTETARLPPTRSRAILGCALPLLHNVALPYFPAAVLQYVLGLAPETAPDPAPDPNRALTPNENG